MRFPTRAMTFFLAMVVLVQGIRHFDTADTWMIPLLFTMGMIAAIPVAMYIWHEARGLSGRS